MFEHVLTQGLSQQCPSQNQFYTFIGCLCFCICSTQFLKNYINRQNCLICVPSPQASSSDTCILPWVFTWFSNGTTGPKQPIKSTKSKFAPLKWENWQRVRSRSLTFVLFCQPFKKPTTNQKTRNQKTKKPKKKTNPKEPNLCYFHESIFLVVLFLLLVFWVSFFWAFWFFGSLYFLFFFFPFSFSLCRRLA